MRRAGGRTTAIVIGAALLIVGCRSADDGTLEGDIPDVTSSSTTTTAPPTSTTAPPACPKVLAPSGNEEQIDASADVDGDGETDAAHSFRVASDDGPSYVLAVELAAGGGATLDLPVSGEGSAALVGGAAIEERDVLWVRVGSGAATTILGLYWLDGCKLRAATFENGEPVELPIGGTVGTASGAECTSEVDLEADLQLHEATLISGREYEVVTTEYRWMDGVLVRAPMREPTVTRTDDLSDVAGFRCGDISL